MSILVSTRRFEHRQSANRLPSPLGLRDLLGGAVLEHARPEQTFDFFHLQARQETKATVRAAIGR
jgi:hypothetical protein